MDLLWLEVGGFDMCFQKAYLALLIGSYGFALLPFNYAQFIEYLRSWNIPCVITGVLKFDVAYFIVFYALNGLRLIVSCLVNLFAYFTFQCFDLAKGTDLKSVYRSGWFVVALSALISFLIVLNSPPKKQIH